MRDKRKVIIICGVMICIVSGLVFFVMKIVPHNTPTTSSNFIEEMKSRSYEVYALKGNDFEGVVEQYKAVRNTDRGNVVNIFFYVFSSKEEARQGFFKLYASISPNSGSTFEFLNESGLIGNTQYYSEITRSSSSFETMMCSVDNTLLIAQSNQYPMPDADSVFESLGYIYP